MKQINENEIHEASTLWSLHRKKLFAPDEVVLCTLNSFLKISGVWAVDHGWQERASAEKFSGTAESLRKDGWSADKPAIIGFGTNGFVTIIDGNHRLVTVLFTDGLSAKVPYVPAKFYFFDVGMPVNPLAPGRIWQGGDDLIFLCYPRGSCGTCVGCKRTLPEVTERLTNLGLE